MKRRHLRTYAALKHYGFSPCKAAEIVIDAQRGGRYGSHAVTVVRLILRGARS